MAILTYQELVALGQIHQWSESVDASEVASGERFNLNEKTAIAMANEAYRLSMGAVGELARMSASDAELATAKSELEAKIDLRATIQSLNDAKNALQNTIDDIAMRVDGEVAKKSNTTHNHDSVYLKSTDFAPADLTALVA